MLARLMCTSVLAFSLAGWSVPAGGQNMQNWMQNEAGQIQQGYGSGMINQSQAARLQNEEAQVVSQDQRYMQQNGGQLTPQEQRQIGSELRHINRQYRGAVGSNYSSANTNNGIFSQLFGAQQRNLSNYNLYPNQGGAYYGGPMPANAGYSNGAGYPPMYQYNSAYSQMSPQQQSAFARYYRRMLQSGN